MVKQSLHEQRKLEDALAAVEKERAAAVAERLVYQRRLEEIAAAEAAEALEALDATRELARGRGIARLVLTLLGVVLVGSFSFFKEEHLLMESNATNVKEKYASVTNFPHDNSLHDHSINMNADVTSLFRAASIKGVLPFASQRSLGPRPNQYWM